MNDAQFDSLVTRLESFARGNPFGYRFRVMGVAVLGDLYLWSMLILLLGIVGVCIWFVSFLKVLGIKLIIFLVPIALIIIKALWIVVPSPEGFRVSRSKAPELFSLIDQVRVQVGAPAFHEVIIDSDFNAGVVQTPRLGVFGWFRNYLIIGLPLLKILTPEQFKAVLSHEYGHLAGGHAKLSNWIYRQRQRWTRLLISLEARGGEGGAFFMRFLKWYAPYLNAYAFPLARANEYAADSVAVRITTAASMAQALSIVKVGSAYLSETFWPSVYRGVKLTPLPETAPYLGFSEQFHNDKNSMPGDRWLRQAMQVKTSTEDSHPSLSDRLAAFGGVPDLKLPAPGCAADQLLGTALVTVTEHLDRAWSEQVAGHWRTQFDQFNQDRETLSLLNERHAAGEVLEFEQDFQRAVLLNRVANDQIASLNLLHELHAKRPEVVDVTFALAMRLLQQDDEEGVSMMEHLIEQNLRNSIPCGQAMYEFFRRHERQNEADELVIRMNALSEELRAAEEERSGVQSTDQFLPNGLDQNHLDELIRQFEKIKGLSSVYLVQKLCQHQPERRLFIVGFSIKDNWVLGRDERVSEVMSFMKNEVEYPAETLIISFDGDNKAFLRSMKGVDGAKLI